MRSQAKGLALCSPPIAALVPGGETTYGSYEGLASNPDVDLVYVNAIHTTHKDMSVLMLEHGKHVLSEKPIAVRLTP